ncbi:MAG: putative DNA-binding domain-containing protein [Rickettsiales bacterium]
MDDYARLIRQFQDAVVENTPKAGDVLARPRPDFDGKAQMQAYIDAYRLRLIKVVTKDYPALAAYLGEKPMRKLVWQFVEATPSRHYNLNSYALPFADYIAQQQNDAFANALAQLEAAILTVYHADDSPALSLQWLQTQPEDYLMRHPLLLRTASALLQQAYDANAYLTTWRADKNPETPTDSPSYLLVHRHRNVVYRTPLSAEAFAILDALAKGHPLESALETLPENAASTLDGTTLQNWLATWINAGVFRQP